MTVALAILAGGQGSRLGGVAKGLLRREGRTLMEAQLALGAHADETLIVANDPAPYRPFAQALGARIVADVIPGRGAPGGLHAALTHVRSDWVLALACDMPFLTWPLLARLLSERTEEVDAAAYVLAQALIPLPSVWRRSLLPGIEARLPSQPSLRALLEQTRLCRVDAGRGEDARGRALFSVNAPEDLTQAGVLRPT